MAAVRGGMLSREKSTAQQTMKRIAQAADDMSPPADAHRLRDLKTILYINITNIVNLFVQWDKDYNGMVSQMEFKNALDSLQIELQDDDEFEKLWLLIDTDKNGTLSLRELKDAIARCANTVLCPLAEPPLKETVEKLKGDYGDGLTDAEQEALRCSMVKRSGGA